MPKPAKTVLAELEQLKYRFGSEVVEGKREGLRRLESASLPTAEAVSRLHELLCFWRAYPDDAQLLRQIEKMLERFGTRRDLRRLRRGLVDSGIEGTEIRYEFFVHMAKWLAKHWPDRLRIDWPEFKHQEALEKILNLLALYNETPGLDEFPFPVRDWIERLKGPDETDAVFVINRLKDLELDTFTHEYLYEHLRIPMIVEAGANGPSRTRAKIRGAAIHYQTEPLILQRPDLIAELKRPPLSVRPVGARKGREIIDLAREAMVTRSRDLDVFAFGDPRDVRMIDCGRGLQFAAFGAIPERRLMFEALYGFLIFKNGVPIGYVLNSSLFGSVEVAYNIFETYRGGEAGYIYGRLLATLRHLFEADTFTIYPYQLGGEDNQEGLESGAWWFYQKLGFRARDDRVLKLMRRELQRMKRKPGYRSSIATLEKLASENVYLDLKRRRDDVIGMLPLGEVGLRITDYLARRFGARRKSAADVCAREAMGLLGVRGWRSWSAGERLAWRRWSPLILILPGLEQWNAAEKKALVAVVRAKGGVRESDFALLFDRHRKLRRAVAKLARGSQAK
ncbi:hypothetical protein H8E07_09475 [bacterium]|nr:hypothetical protein [bacterium]